MRWNLPRILTVAAVGVVFAVPAWGQYGPTSSAPPPPQAVPSAGFGTPTSGTPYLAPANGPPPAAPSAYANPQQPGAYAAPGAYPTPAAYPAPGMYPPPGVYATPAAYPSPAVYPAPGVYPSSSVYSGGSDSRSCDISFACDDDDAPTIVAFSGVESWRGVSDTDWQSNNGMSTGVNFGAGVPWLKEYGFGFQLGLSYGVYDWNGRGGFSDNFYAQQQTFVTAGFFRKADCNSNFSIGLVYDWMINDNFGIEASDGTLGQWRGQVSYQLNPRNEVGVWLAVRDRAFTQDSFFGPLTYRGVDQCNLFWHHKYREGADGYFWIGAPDHTKLGGDGSLGDLILGASFNVPISDHMALYANAAYMHPSSSPGFAAAIEETWSIGFGIAFYPGHNARTATVNGSRWSPLQNVANNGTFMVDSDVWGGI